MDNYIADITKMKILYFAFFTIISSFSLNVNAASIAGISIDDNAIANQVNGSFGTFLNWNPDNDATGISALQLASDMTDDNAGSYVFSYDADAYIDMSFTNANVYNGAGNDIALFFVGSGGHTGNLRLLDTANSTISFSSLTYTGYSITELFNDNDGNPVISPIYVSYIDLDILGINGSTALNNFRLEIGDASAVPSLLAALNTAPMAPVPLPAPFLLFLSGLTALGAISRRKK